MGAALSRCAVAAAVAAVVAVVAVAAVAAVKFAQECKPAPTPAPVREALQPPPERADARRPSHSPALVSPSLPAGRQAA